MEHALGICNIRPANSVLSINLDWIIIIYLLGGHCIRVCYHRICFTYNGVVFLRDCFSKHVFLWEAALTTLATNILRSWWTDEWEWSMVQESNSRIPMKSESRTNPEYSNYRKQKRHRYEQVLQPQASSRPFLTSKITVIARVDWVTTDSRTMQSAMSFKNANVTGTSSRLWLRETAYKE